MNDKEFLEEYFNKFQRILDNSDIYTFIMKLRDTILIVKENRNKIIFAGNGASAAIASHFALDFTKQAKVRSIFFSDPSLITAYSNDYGFENWVMKTIEHHCYEGDLVILISSSGKSLNMVNAADKAKEMGILVATLTGFSEDNPLKSRGDINLWLDSRSYNIIESAHSFCLAALCDLLVGESEYSVTE